MSETGAARVALLDRAQQLVLPERSRHELQFTQSTVLARALDRQREAQGAAGSHQSVPVDPAGVDVVHVVEQHEPVDRTHQLEVAQIREGIGLHEGQLHIASPRTGHSSSWRFMAGIQVEPWCETTIKFPGERSDDH
ncbi:MAG: hypothetical protein QFE16_04155 [Pseudomonadota bacterium]|nr:hypothetical protein [Pseudomonadota bacterium]